MSNSIITEESDIGLRPPLGEIGGLPTFLACRRLKQGMWWLDLKKTRRPKLNAPLKIYNSGEVYLKHLNFNQTTFDRENSLYDCTEIPANTRDTAVKVCGCVAVSKYGYRTRNRDTRFGNTAGFPVPVPNPNCWAPINFLTSTT
jgi:hypothetical protein